MIILKQLIRIYKVYFLYLEAGDIGYLCWLMRVSTPKGMNFVYEDSLTHSNLKTDMTGKRVLNITGKIFVGKFQNLQSYRQLFVNL